ncbi:uncharacterized protein V1478_007737 [Vespula squamosa]|uniref:Uncharacterized protein n=1 Tax=Vespula squamosa TaxID=30214 RepID=A0ABD2AWR9_VESSQ
MLLKSSFSFLLVKVSYLRSQMWMSILSGLETFVSAYATDKVVSESVNDEENSQTADFDGSLPSTQQLLEMLDSITGMSDEEKDNLRADLMKNIQDRASDVQQIPTRDLINQTFILLSLLAVVALIFGKYRERRAKKSTHYRSLDFEYPRRLEPTRLSSHFSMITQTFDLNR